MCVFDYVITGKAVGNIERRVTLGGREGLFVLACKVLLLDLSVA